MNLNTIYKIFPKDNCNNMEKLWYDNEGLWSITHPDTSNIISEEILKLSNELNLNKTIVDLNSGLGGNLLSFANFFDKVGGVEIDDNRFQILKNNVENYNYDNIEIYHDDCVKIIPKIKNHYDIFFFDPPWGGPTYKNHNNIKIKLSNINLEDIINKYENKLIILKLPYNYENKFSNIIKKIKFGNICILFIFCNKTKDMHHSE
jgi:16S rRNA G966 N2-methylase RsmD